MVTITLSVKELATVLAALRLLQGQSRRTLPPEHFEEHRPLTSAEIDDLCERINTSGGCEGQGDGTTAQGNEIVGDEVRNRRVRRLNRLMDAITSGRQKGKLYRLLTNQ